MSYPINASSQCWSAIQQDFTSIDSSNMYSYVIQHAHDVKRTNTYIMDTYMNKRETTLASYMLTYIYGHDFEI